MGIRNGDVIYNHWVDFVIYPTDADHVRTGEQRLDTQSLPYLRVDGKTNPAYRVGEAAILTQSDVLSLDEEFEAMEVSEYGRVTIWTRDAVLAIARLRGVDRIGEKIIRLPRHPGQNALPQPEVI